MESAELNAMSYFEECCRNLEIAQEAGHYATQTTTCFVFERRQVQLVADGLESLTTTSFYDGLGRTCDDERFLSPPEEDVLALPLPGESDAGVGPAIAHTYLQQQMSNVPYVNLILFRK